MSFIGVLTTLCDGEKSWWLLDSTSEVRAIAIPKRETSALDVDYGLSAHWERWHSLRAHVHAHANTVRLLKTYSDAFFQ